MRWCVSIGAVLVAGAMAGGDVAGIAAPNPGYRSADKETVPSVDVELVPRRRCLVFDGHGTKLAIQPRGYAQAIVSKEFPAGAETGPNGKIR